MLSTILLQAATLSLGKLGATIGAGIAVLGAALGIGKIGANAMELSIGISGELSEIIFSIIIFLMAAEGGISRAIQERQARRKIRARLREEGRQ